MEQWMVWNRLRVTLISRQVYSRSMNLTGKAIGNCLCHQESSDSSFTTSTTINCFSNQTLAFRTSPVSFWICISQTLCNIQFQSMNCKVCTFSLVNCNVNLNISTVNDIQWTYRCWIFLARILEVGRTHIIGTVSKQGEGNSAVEVVCQWDLYRLPSILLKLH